MSDGTPILWERDHEVRTLTSAIEAARHGRSGFILVEGPGGMGKTTLLSFAGRTAVSSGFRVLRARGSELEQGFGFGIVRQLFEPALARAGQTQRDRWLQGGAQPAASALGPLEGGDAPVGDFAVLHGLYWLTANMCASTPMILIVDDLHLADAASLRFLTYLLPRMEGLALGILAGARPRDPHRDRDLLAHILTDPVTTVLRPGPLSPDAAARVVRDVIGSADRDFCTACRELTGGNPLLLRELAVAAASQRIPTTAESVSLLPAIVGDAIGRRVRLQLRGLEAEATTLAQAVAIMDGKANLAEAASVAALESTQAWQVLASLTAADILLQEEPLTFVHPIVQAAINDMMDGPQRVRLHQRAARVLASIGAPRERVAAHLMQTEPAAEPEVVAALRAGAAEALTHAAPESALAYLERALQEPPTQEERPGLLRSLGEVAMLVDGRKAVDYLTRALTAAEEAQAQGEIADMLGRSLFAAGRTSEAMTVLTEAVSRLDEREAEQADLRRRLQANMINTTLANVELHDASERLVSKLREAPQEPGLGGRLLDALIGWYDGIAALDAEAALTRTRRAFADGILVEKAVATEAFADAVWTLISADQDDVVRLLDGALDRSHRVGSTFGTAVVLAFRGLAWLRQGFLAEAETDARESVRLAESVHLDVLRPLVASFLADTLMERGELGAAEQALSWADQVSLPAAAAQLYWTRISHGRLLVHQGRPGEGTEALIESGRRFEEYGWRNSAYLDWRTDAALGLDACGRHSEARALAMETLDLARRWGAPRALGQALRVGGVVTGREEGLIMLRSAVEVLRPSHAQLEHAKALCALGVALRRANERGEARACLAKALDLADRAGATPLIELARAEIRVSGGRPRRTAITGPDALTPSEHRVAVLAAAGHTNRVIAQQLFVTPKTVEVHLSSVYRKLGITRRYQLSLQGQLAGTAGTESP